MTVQVIAENSLERLGTLLQDHYFVRVLFVFDEAAYQASGAAERVEPLFRSREVARFSGFQPNPNEVDLRRGLLLTEQLRPDVVIAFGGGTAMDLGKLISRLPPQPDAMRQVILGNVPVPQTGPPLIVIPTTAGSGSESTHFAVVYVDGKKYSVADEALLPAHVIIDPVLTHSLPASVTMACGLDALSQSIESIWAVGSTTESIEYASQAASLAFEHLETAVNAPTPTARHAMCVASNLAGKAINISKTTAPHAISYAMTSQHGIPHGIAVAMLLGEVLEFNALVSGDDCVDPRGTDHVNVQVKRIVKILKADDVRQAREQFDRLLGNIGCPRSPSEAGITNENALRRIAQSVNFQRLSNNPRRVETEDVYAMLRHR